MTEQGWFKNAVVYQVYPRSFADANGDGIGDLPGVVEHLDHLQYLDVDALWLSPVYASPMADFGYDVSDYKAIDPVFGDMDDFDRLVDEAHKKDLKVIMDFVPSHTSSEHPWFTEARSSLDNPKRDWYVWRPPKADGSPPNNWLSGFRGSAWTFDERTGQHYLHSFLPEQPDLNWNNPEVREAIYDAMRFWLDRGVDGLRVDAVNFLYKDPDYQDNPINELSCTDKPSKVLDAKFSRDGPDMKRWLHQFAQVAKEFQGRCLFFEGDPHTNKKRADPCEYLRYYEWCEPGISAPFNFGLIFLPWQAAKFKEYIDAYQGHLPPGHTGNYVLGNHDRQRLASRIGQEAVSAAAVLQLALPGAQFIYYGEEIGMVNGVIPPERLRDRAPGYNHDPKRTPMQWSAASYGGFSTVEPWLPVNPDYRERNVEALQQQNDSLLSLYKAMIKLRKQSEALAFGEYVPLQLDYNDVLGFVRQYKSDKVGIFVNFGNEPASFDTGLEAKTLLITSYMDSGNEHSQDPNRLILRPHEAVIIQY